LLLSVENDPQARFRAFFEEHYGAVLAYAYRRIGGGAAEDLAADTFLVAWRRFDTIPDDPLPWLFAVAKNLISNHRRGAIRRDAFLMKLKREPLPVLDDPGEQVGTRTQILAAFRRLSARDRETLALVAWEGLSAERAAKVVGCSVGAFWVRVHRARRRLAKELESRTARDASILIHDMETEQG
jgi:RNA polymerase sigma-70 factor (ECF subfamily)